MQEVKIYTFEVMTICSIASGSNGNCYYLGNDTEAILIDAGISCREIEKRMERQALDITKVKALFISHEHTDHISGMKIFSSRYRVPVFITHATLRHSYKRIEKHLIYHFKESENITIGGLTIIPFRKCHDAVDPHSFVVRCNGVNVGVFTDIGHACDAVTHYFSQCNAVFLESNYCNDMLWNGSYPVFLKKRISGNEGHLSNAQALQLFIEKKNNLSHLILSHLSKNNNSPELVSKMFGDQCGTTHIAVASRYCEGATYEITANSALKVAEHKKTSQQLELFSHSDLTT